MTETNNLLLYVADPETSGRFYAGLLGLEAVEVSPTFVLLMLRSGLALGLWKASGVEPVPTASGGGSELGFKVARAPDVDATYAAWLTRGARIALPPTDLDFGRSFVALDPDGHRLRVYALADAA